MPVETPITDLVAQLRRAGLRPNERLVKQILDHGAEAIDPLLALACAIALLDEAEPLCWGPLHAARLLGELMNADIATTLLDMLPIEVDDPDAPTPHKHWGIDIFQLIGRGGAALIPLLWARADDPARDELSRAATLETLPFITASAPESRDELIAAAHSRLAQEKNPIINAYLVKLLASLGAQQYYSEIMTLYRTKRVNSDYFPAATARQALLSGGDKQLKCTLHSFWERYDEHGPFPAEFEEDDYA